MQKYFNLVELAARLALIALIQADTVPAEVVAVRHAEGLAHGFLVLRSLDGAILANGDLSQVAQGARVSSQLTFRFRDGSLQEETAVYSQRGNFRLLNYRLRQKGPIFKRAMDLATDGSTGQVTARFTEDGGKEKIVTDRLELPPDLANGMVLTLLKNLRPKAPTTTLSMVVAAPKPRLVKLAITSEGEDSFSVGGVGRKATRYVIKVEIGGVSGLVAPLVGKQPPDTHVWILGGTAPAFVKSEGPLYQGGPICRIELINAVWPKAGGDAEKNRH